MKCTMQILRGLARWVILGEGVLSHSAVGTQSSVDSRVATHADHI